MSIRKLPPVAVVAFSMSPKTAARSKSPGVVALAPASAMLPVPNTEAMSLLPRTVKLLPPARARSAALPVSTMEARSLLRPSHRAGPITRNGVD
jgi:hypothetical protein